jgi:(2Fe-2S) ferredoxin
MTSDDKPQQAPYARHVFLCHGKYCDPQGRAIILYEKLRSLLAELSTYDNPERVKRGLSPCLGVCSAGPLMVVYPEGVWYHHVDEALLQRVVDQHLRHNQPVQEAIFHQLLPVEPPQ